MRRRTLLQSFAVALLSFAAATPAAPVPEAKRPAIPSVQTAILRPLEVRTRRLHRVRPDLIHFPVRYDTFC
jgi:hypothetical protein